ncbi:MAG: matrixin family metalloprotease [Gemmatales bacterium]
MSALGNINLRISDLPGTTLGQARGNTITLDSNAAGWGWFVDKTPKSDSEFRTRGNQGEQGRMDLLTVLEHEVGHMLGFEHQQSGIMADTLFAGVRRMPHQAMNPSGQASVDILSIFGQLHTCVIACSGRLKSQYQSNPHHVTGCG